MVRDSQGRKMSKTLGNGIDPMDIIEQYGADSLRYSVISGTTMGNDIKYMPEKIRTSFKLCKQNMECSQIYNDEHGI